MPSMLCCAPEPSRLRCEHKLESCLLIFVTDLRSQLDLHSHGDRPHHAGDVLMKVRHQLRGIDYPLPEQEAVRDDLVARIEQTIREVEPGRLGPHSGPI